MSQPTRDQELRAIILECLSKPRQHRDPPLAVDALYGEVAEIAKARDLKHDTGASLVNAWHDDRNGYPKLHDAWMGRIWSVVWDLIIEGVLRPGIENSGSWALPNVYVTGFGKQVLRHPATPYDPGGYLERLHERVPNVDPVIITYLAESIEALRRNCLLSSTVTLGCASEQAMLLLIEKTGDACSPATRASFQSAMAKLRSIKQQNEEYRNWLDSHLRARLKADKGNDWTSEMENALLFLFNYFRVLRNDAGHPTGTKVSRDQATANLVVFPHYLRLVYDLIEWLGANKPI
jgi:hypothetical protein